MFDAVVLGSDTWNSEKSELPVGSFEGVKLNRWVLIPTKLTDFTFPLTSYHGLLLVVVALFAEILLSFQSPIPSPVEVIGIVPAESLNNVFISVESNHNAQSGIYLGSNVDANFVDLATVVIIVYIKRIVLSVTAEITNDCPFPGGITNGDVNPKTFVRVILK